MRIVSAEIPDVKVLLPVKREDRRGFLSETYHERMFADAGIDIAWVQENHTLSHAVGVVRGLHFQRPPRAQDKLVRVLRGAIYDVALDLRRNAPTFGRHIGIRLSADEWNQLLIPKGFAHGFCTLEPDTEVLYKLSDYYSPAHEGGLLWSDPRLGIAWPVGTTQAIVAERDNGFPALHDLVSPF